MALRHWLATSIFGLLGSTATTLAAELQIAVKTAMATVVNDKAILPLVFWVSTCATTPNLAYVPQASQATLAMTVRAAP